MRIFKFKTLSAFWTAGHADAEEPLRGWYKKTERAAWETPADLKASYAQASVLAGNRAIFDIGGNKYRLICHIHYGPIYAVYVRFVGTHAEYDKVDATKV